MGATITTSTQHYIGGPSQLDKAIKKIPFRVIREGKEVQGL